MSYRANQLNASVRVGLVSSEEISGGRGSPMVFGTLFPGFGGLRQMLRVLNLSSHKGGDDTVDVDSQVSATKALRKEKVCKALRCKRWIQSTGKTQLTSQIAPNVLAGLLCFPQFKVF